MPVLLEWLRGFGRKLSAEGVKRLPVGTKVVCHGADRHGEHTMLECTVQRVGRAKKLVYRDEDQVARALTIREDEGRAYTMGKGN